MIYLIWRQAGAGADNDFNGAKRQHRVDCRSLKLAF